MPGERTVGCLLEVDGAVSDCSHQLQRRGEMQASSRTGNPDSSCSPTGFLNSVHDTPCAVSPAVVCLCLFSDFWFIFSPMGYTSESFP